MTHLDSKFALISPFHGGSHKYWATQYQFYSDYQWDIYSLPDKYWKWRMYGASIYLARQLNTSTINYNGLLTTDLLDVGLLKSLLDSKYRDLPLIVYFHENQLTYPWSPTDSDPQTGKDHHYGFVNYTSALVADKMIFNSDYHKNSFIDAARDLISQMPDYRSMATLDEIEAKSSVVGIGVHQYELRETHKNQQIIPRILWNHRWEYDKNPELFFNTLTKLADEKIQFELVLLGSATSKIPQIFKASLEILKDKIRHSGYLESKEQYLQILASCTHVPITSNQDFFGISAVEAMSHGCIPLLPKRLAFVEHLDPTLFPQYFYESDKEFYTKLKNQLVSSLPTSTEQNEIQREMKKYSWNRIAPQLDKEISRILT